MLSTIPLENKTSRYFVIFIFSLFLISSCAIFSSSISLSIKLALELINFSILIIEFLRIDSFKYKNKFKYIRYLNEFDWQLCTDKTEFLTLRLKHFMQFPFCVVLEFKVQNRFFPLVFIIFKDTISNRIYRKLNILLFYIKHKQRA